MFNINNGVTISLKKYEELIRTSQKYDILYRILYNRFKDLFDGIIDQLKEIDWDKYKEMIESKKEEN